MKTKVRKVPVKVSKDPKVSVPDSSETQSEEDEEYIQQTQTTTQDSIAIEEMIEDGTISVQKVDFSSKFNVFNYFLESLQFWVF